MEEINLYVIYFYRFRATLMKLVQWNPDVSTPTTRVGFLSPLACDEQTDGTGILVCCVTRRVSDRGR